MVLMRRLMKCTAATFFLLVGAIIGHGAGSVSDRACEGLAMIFVVTLGITFFYCVGYTTGKTEPQQANHEPELRDEATQIV